MNVLLRKIDIISDNELDILSENVVTNIFGKTKKLFFCARNFFIFKKFNFFHFLI